MALFWTLISIPISIPISVPISVPIRVPNTIPNIVPISILISVPFQKFALFWMIINIPIKVPISVPISIPISIPIKVQKRYLTCILNVPYLGLLWRNLAPRMGHKSEKQCFKIPIFGPITRNGSQESCESHESIRSLVSPHNISFGHKPWQILCKQSIVYLTILKWE